MAGLRRYFKPVAALPTAAETGIGEVATTAGNKAVQQAAIVVESVRPTLLSPTSREPKYENTLPRTAIVQR